MLRRNFLNGATRRRQAQGRARFDVIPNVEVWTHDGRKMRFYDDLVKNRVVTLNFFYVECGQSCPLITANLRRVQDLMGNRVGRDIFMYSITLRPEVETPDMLRAYAEGYQAKPGWLFLTGAPPDIERLRLSLGFSDPDPALDVLDDTHTGILRFGNDALQRWAGCPALARPEGIVGAITGSVWLNSGLQLPSASQAQAKVRHTPKHKDKAHQHHQHGKHGHGAHQHHQH